MTSPVVDHLALLYRDVDEYLAGTVPSVVAGLACGDPVLVAVPRHNLDLIRCGLGRVADRVRLCDMSVAGANPGRILPGLLLAFAAARPGKRVRIRTHPAIEDMRGRRPSPAYGDPVRVAAVPLPADRLRGRGLVNQVCDLVRVHTGPGGTTIRLPMRR